MISLNLKVENSTYDSISHYSKLRLHFTLTLYAYTLRLHFTLTLTLTLKYATCSYMKKHLNPVETQ